MFRFETSAVNGAERTRAQGVPRACRSTGRAGEVEWTPQMLVAFVVEPYTRLHEQVQEAAGPSKPFPNCSGRESSLVRLPAISSGGVEDGNGHQPLATRHSDSVRRVAPGGTARAGMGMSMFHPKPIYGDDTCWLGVPLLRGGALPYENRWVSRRLGSYTDRRRSPGWHRVPSPVMRPTSVRVGIE